MTFKNLAKRAKDRLSSAVDTSQKTVSVALSSNSAYYVVSSSGYKAESDPLYPKVKKMMEIDADILCPIGKLIDHSVFDNLSPDQKDKYLLELTKRYHKIKKHLLSKS